MQYLLEAFFQFLVTFDRPFVIILPDKIAIRDYFGASFARIRQPEDFYIFGLNKSFCMKNEAEARSTVFSGLTVITYLKKDWNFVLKRSKFEHVFNKQLLHWK